MLADHGIPKTHETFRELYAWVTRGTSFALVRSFLPYFSILPFSSPLFRQVVLVLIYDV